MTIIESRISKTIIIVSFFCNSFFSKAQNNSNTVTVTLKEVVLNSPKTSTELNKLPFAVSFQEVEQYQNIFQQIESLEPEILVIDSIQTLHSSQIESSPGSVSQVKACKVRQTYNTLTNPQARRLLKEVS